MNKEKAKQDLMDVTKVLKKYKTKFFLIYGTALGAVRDGDFLDGDDDIDLGTFDNSHFEEIRKDLEELGFDIGICYDVEQNVEVPAVMVLSERNVRVDLYFFEKKSDGYIANKHNFSRHPLLFMPLEFSNTKKIDFLGEEFRVPAPTDKYLEFLYGDWRDKNNKRQGKLYAEHYGIKEDTFI